MQPGLALLSGGKLGHSQQGQTFPIPNTPDQVWKKKKRKKVKNKTKDRQAPNTTI